MKLILTQEVSGLGAPGDVVEVKDGYGRNYLVPRGLAMRWTRGAEKQIGSITVADVADAVEKAGGPAVDKRRIEIEQPIKTLGAHRVTVRVHPEVKANLTVEVVSS